MERFRYDRSGKWMIEYHGDAILLVSGIRDVQAWRSRTPEVVQPRQMPDGLLEVRRAGDDKFYPFIVEIETYPKRETAQKLLDDIVFVWQALGVVPDVIVLVLHPKGDLEIQGSHEAQSHSGLTQMTGSWHIVELWKVPAAELLAHIDGPPEPVMRECRRVIDTVARPEEHANLLAVSQIFGGLRYNAAVLHAIYGGKEKMIESPVLQELIAEQRAEATMQGKHEMLLGFLEDRFGPVPADVRSSVAAITNDLRLRELLRQASASPDLDAFRRHLAP